MTTLFIKVDTNTGAQLQQYNKISYKNALKTIGNHFNSLLGFHFYTSKSQSIGGNICQKCVSDCAGCDYNNFANDWEKKKITSKRRR